MNPEHKDLPNLTNKLSDLRNEMSGMEQAVVKEDAAIGDFRRQTAKSAMSHKVSSSQRVFLLSVSNARRSR